MAEYHPNPFPLEEAARRLGHYRWIEMRLFEILGGWAASVPEVAVKLLLAPHSFHHAWHSELWHKRLPQLREMSPEAMTVPPNDTMVEFVDALVAPKDPDETIEKMVGVYRVLIPHKITAYGFHLDHTEVTTDGPTIRWLRHVLQDEMDDWREGEMLIQSLLQTPDEVQRAAAHQARLEALLVAAGGIAGPGSIGAPVLPPGAAATKR
ncbi:MAG: hypothetical protein KY454_10825 [Actinobacteria bacterium]|nr:hypothetical protein [Actinomycetota bacterium]MBW3649655.1 hypothetical protein [Actinomycetota bacterium]